jgi:hypothetical protein
MHEKRSYDAPLPQADADRSPAMAPEMGGLVARGLLRGLGRAFAATDHAVLAELPLANGRRADLVALDRAGAITLVEIKSCLADFRADQKWQDYLDYCDRFFFAVNAEFPAAVLPAGEGLIIADPYGAEILRPAVARPLAAGRRKAMLLRFARAGAQRLQGLLDPLP